MAAGRMERAAQKYAALDWSVLPVQPGKKTPLHKGWQDAATCDPDQIAAWWSDNPDANVGVATGPASGIFVLDVDGAEGEASVVALEAKHGPLPELYPMQFTGSGEGWQAVFSLPEGRTIKNSAGKLGTGIDIRGAGGFAVVPPSIHPSGGRYVWADDRSPLDLEPEPVPAWLLDLLDPPQAARPDRGKWRGPPAPAGEDRRVLKAFRGELALVAAAANGRRNDQLNESAYALLRFVNSGDLPGRLVRDALADAATHAGLGPIEALNTIRSAASARGVDVG